MGLLDETTQNQYYQGDNYGNYQFTSLDDIIDYFMVVYVGDQKIIQKASRIDVAFHAQRALAELSFDTFKSIKSQQIEVPATLQMILPHDYVNYTKLSWVDGSGIKHPLYSTKHTNNPFEITQNTDGTYFFGDESNNVINPDFDLALSGTWKTSVPGKSSQWDSFRQSQSTPPKYYVNNILDTLTLTNGELEFGQLHQSFTNVGSRAYAAWQRIDVEFANQVELKATASSGAQQLDGSTILCDYGVVRVGITSTNPDVGWNVNSILSPATNTSIGGNSITPNNIADNYDLGYVEWSDGTTSQKEIEVIDVSAHTEIWVYIQSFSPWTSSAITTLTQGVFNGGTTEPLPSASVNNTHQKNTVDFVSVVVPGQIQKLTHANADNNSSTWDSYKSTTPSENNNDDYEDDTYWPVDGERYGLEPSHAQVNGSFFIDQLLGKIHFSSNISGKTVILDYISDSLGTEAEMQVHKLAEDAMYKCMTHAILSTSSYGQALVPRLTKEKFAAVRKAKLRLSNIKIEELTQILRGKSKQIKH